MKKTDEDVHKLAEKYKEKRGSLLKEMFPGKHAIDLTEEEREEYKKEYAKRKGQELKPSLLRELFPGRRLVELTVEERRIYRRVMMLTYYQRNRERLIARERKRSRVKRGTLGATDEVKVGKCEICGREQNLHFDHDHETGEFRGWLCVRCNMWLGQMGDTKEKVQKVVEYLIGIRRSEVCLPLP